ncbi:Suppressor of fused protein (SUFU) [compost metagenome]
MEAEEIANTSFGCMLLLPPMLSFDEEFLELTTKDGKIINFYAMIPVYKEEMDYKLEEGTDALLDLFDEYGISELVDIDRPNVCKR